MTQEQAAAHFGVTAKTWWTWEQKGPSKYGKLLLEKEGWL